MSTRVLQPALIIGVGGSGIEIVRRFKRRFQALYPDTSYVRMLGIDTAPQTEASEDLPRLTDDEFLHAANFRMEFYVGENYIARHPSIRSWWRGYNRIPLRQISMGAGQRRPVGRLALFVMYDQIVARLRANLLEIFGEDVIRQVDEPYRKAVNVYVVGSTCGGTGTGMFLDLAYLASDVVATHVPNATPWVRSLLLLPSVFIDTGKIADQQTVASLRANAYGALTELDYSMRKGAELPPLRFPDNREVSRSGQPFRSCYLVGNCNSNGAFLRDFDEILERVAVHMQIEIASPLTGSGLSYMDNVLSRIAAKPEAQGRPRLYSSFHGDWIELPSRRIIARWTKRLSLLILEQLKGAGSTGNVEEARKALDSAQAFGELRSLIAGRGLNRYQPKVDAEITNFQSIGDQGEDPSTLLDRARALEAAAQRQIHANAALSTLVEDAVRGVLPEIYRQASDVLVTGSLGDARQFLSRVQADLENWLAQTRSDVGHSSGDTWLTSFAERVQGLKQGFFTKKSAIANEQRQFVIDAVQEAYRSWERALRARVAATTQDQLPGIVAGTRVRKEQIEQFSTVVEAAAVQVERRSDPPIPPGMALESTDDATTDSAFEAPGRLERLILAARDGIRTLLNEDRPSADHLAHAVWRAADHAVRVVAPEYLRALSVPAEDIGDRMDRLAPLVVYTPDWGAMPESAEVEELSLIGLPEGMVRQKEAILERISFSNRSQIHTVAHTDEERVILTVQCHGFPLYSLQEVRACRTAFDQTDAAERVLRYTFPEEEVRRWDVMPVEPREAVQWFTLALALGWIRQRGREYVFNSKADGNSGLSLASHADPAEARQAAKDEFLRAGLGSEVKLAIDARLDREGNAPLFSELGRWIEQQEQFAASEPAYPPEFRADIGTVREYRNSIRPF